MRKAIAPTSCGKPLANVATPREALGRVGLAQRLPFGRMEDMKVVELVGEQVEGLDEIGVGGLEEARGRRERGVGGDEHRGDEVVIVQTGQELVGDDLRVRIGQNNAQASPPANSGRSAASGFVPQRNVAGA